MIKFLVSYSATNVFTLSMQMVENGEGVADMGATIKHLITIVGEEARFQIMEA